MLEIKLYCQVRDCGQNHVARGLCAAHYKRWQRYGDVTVINRPSDWGSREKHPLFGRWHQMKRYPKNEVDPRWLDFWAFVEDIGEAPQGHRLMRRNTREPFSEANCYWRAISRSAGARAAHAGEMRSYRKANPRMFKDYELRKRYGITIDEYEAMLEKQGHKCAICKRHENEAFPNGKRYALSIDHCHVTNRVRGLLCHACNRALGMFQDDPECLLAAITYLSH